MVVGGGGRSGRLPKQTTNFRRAGAGELHARSYAQVHVCSVHVKRHKCDTSLAARLIRISRFTPARPVAAAVCDVDVAGEFAVVELTYY